MEPNIQKLKSLISKNGLTRASELLGMKNFELARVSNMTIDNPNDAYELILSLMMYDNKLTRRFDHDGYSVSIEPDGLEGSVMWVIENNTTYYSEEGETEAISAYATPFWDGESILPIEVNYYQIFDENNISGFESLNLNLDFYRNIKIGTVYKNIDSLIEWYEEKYIPIVFNTIINVFLPEIREYASKSRR